PTLTSGIGFLRRRQDETAARGETARRGASGREATRRRLEVTGWLRGTSPTATATASHSWLAVSVAISLKCHVKNKGIRKFLDGINVSDKGAINKG
ncbi:unnamed protein product, partial [Urochloa humidicola]